MSETVWLNVVRHPEQPVNRRDFTYDQFIDPARQEANDDIHPQRGPAQVAAGVERIRFDPDRPLLISYSPFVRARKGAELFAAALGHRLPVEIREEPALSEVDIVWPRILTRAEYEDPRRPPTMALLRIVRSIAQDDRSRVAEGRDAMLARLAALRDLLASSGLVNHLWVTHSPVMTFIYLGIVHGLPPEEWTEERLGEIGMFDFATGFSAPVAIPATSGGRAAAPPGQSLLPRCERPA